MSRVRLFIPAPIQTGRAVELDAEQAHYLRRVLRMRAGDELTIFDGSGDEFPAAISELRRDRAVLDARRPRHRDAESPLRIRLVQGVSRGERMDFVVQKATELGVWEIQPVLTRRSIVRLSLERAGKRAEHWRRIAINACEQCGRNRVPAVTAPATLAEFLAGGTDAALRIALSPTASNGLDAAADPGGGVVELLVGPEGGLAEDEIADAGGAGFVSYSMGPRILRSETAGMTAIALLQARWGDLARRPA